MKKMLFLLILFSMSLFASDGIIKQDWEAALKAAKESNKAIFVDFYTDWCGWCKVMDDKTFSDEKIKAFINQNFIFVKINCEETVGIDLAMKYRINGFPSFGFFKPNGRLYWLTSGYQPPLDFIKKLEEGKNKINAPDPFKGISDEMDPGFPDFYKKAFAKQGEKAFPEEGIVDAYLDSRENMFDEASFAVLSFFDSPGHNNFFLENLDKYRELYGSTEVREKLFNIIYSKHQESVEKKDITLHDKVLEMIRTYDDKEFIPVNIRFYKMKYAEDTKNWGMLVDYLISEKHSDTDKKIDDNTINDKLWSLYMNCDDISVIKKALPLQKEVINATPNYAYTDTYAALLYKSGNFKESEKYALKAIEAGKSEKIDTKPTEELLQNIRDKMNAE